MRIAIGCDQRGIDLKQNIIKFITESGHSYEDFGSFTRESIDYPDIAVKVADAVAQGNFDRGILICGTGIGMCIAANKVKGIRAAQCLNAFMAQRARLHNDAQICCLSAEVNTENAPEIVNTFLTTDFEGGRHMARLNKIHQIEER